VGEAATLGVARVLEAAVVTAEATRPRAMSVTTAAKASTRLVSARKRSATSRHMRHMQRMMARPLYWWRVQALTLILWCR
jgi:hypothetical protein